MTQLSVASEKGFTIVESLVSMGVFSVGILGMLSAFTTAVRFNHVYERKSAAVYAAQQALDELRVSDPSSLPTSGTTSQTITINSKPYTVQTIYCPLGGTYCAATSSRYLRIRVSRDSLQLYEVDTVFTQLR
jgi:type II secretory pathway pseudopilin PulG